MKWIWRKKKKAAVTAALRPDNEWRTSELKHVHVVHMCHIWKKKKRSSFRCMFFFVHLFYAFLFVNTQLLLKLWHWDSCQTFVPIINVNWYAFFCFLLSSFHLQRSCCCFFFALYNIFISVGCECIFPRSSYCSVCLRRSFYIYLLRIKYICATLVCYICLYCVRSEQVWFSKNAPALTQQEIIKCSVWGRLFFFSLSISSFLVFFFSISLEIFHLFCLILSQPISYQSFEII